MHLIGNRYRIKSLIGEGGMASVYSAIDEKLDRRVAVKILHPHLGRIPDIRRRFHLEAKSISGIDHPNIIKVFDFSGDESEQLWIVTEILYGVDLSEYVQKFKSNRLHPILAAVVVREICSALEVVHKNGIVHRDIKSENIMMLDAGAIKLMDFGIAKVVANQNTTQTGTFMGSPSYMSVEQIKGVKVDARTDIYSLNVLFYEIATGSLPYMGNSTADVINRIVHGTYKPPIEIRSSLPQDINDLIIWGLHKEKEKRPGSTEEFKNALDRLLADRKIYDTAQSLRTFFRDPHLFFKMVSTKKEGMVTPPMTMGDDHPQRTKVVDKLIRETLASLPQADQAIDDKPQLESRRNKTTKKRVAAKEATRISNPPRQKTRQSSRRRRNQVVSDQNTYYSPKTHFWSIALGVAVVMAMIFGGVILRNKKDDTIRTVGSKTPNVKKVAVPPPSTQVLKKRKPSEPSNRRSTTTKKRTSRPRIAPRNSVNKTRPRASSRPKNQVVMRSAPQGVSEEVRTRPATSRSPRPIESNPPSRVSKPIEINRQGKIRVTTRPAAEIYIDNQLFGTSNDRALMKRGISLKPGSYMISLKRIGYEDVNERIQLGAGQNLSLNFSLKKTVSPVKLMIQTNKLPTYVEIQGVPPSSVRRTMNLLNALGSVELFPGAYRVTATYQGEKIERTINLGTESLTFSARFGP